jgi:hypothetical protein
MKEIFIKYKIVILRTVGILMLVIGFTVHFWVTPKKGFTQNEIAARNVARMEARAMGSSGSFKKTSKSSSAEILKELKNAQEKQMQYLTIIAMILGVGFLGYSFIKRD